MGRPADRTPTHTQASLTHIDRPSAKLQSTKSNHIAWASVCPLCHPCCTRTRVMTVMANLPLRPLAATIRPLPCSRCRRRRLGCPMISPSVFPVWYAGVVCSGLGQTPAALCLLVGTASCNHAPISIEKSEPLGPRLLLYHDPLDRPSSFPSKTQRTMPPCISLTSVQWPDNTGNPIEIEAIAASSTPRSVESC